MNLFDKIVYGLMGTMPTPSHYSVWHLVSILLVIITCVFVCLFLGKAKEKTVKFTLLGIWIALVLFEVYKQIIFAFNYNDGNPTYSLAWYSFPFQLCSSILYVLPFVIFLKDGKVKDACISYLTTFSLFGGLAVYVFPGDVFMKYIGINIQTMFHHGSQIVVAVLLIARNKDKLNLSFLIKALPVFAILCLIAIILNEVVIYLIPSGHTFNMFYISSRFDCTLPILSMIYPVIPYPLFLIMYILGFTLIAFIIFYAQKGIVYLVNKYAVKK